MFHFSREEIKKNNLRKDSEKRYLKNYTVIIFCIWTDVLLLRGLISSFLIYLISGKISFPVQFYMFIL